MAVGRISGPLLKDNLLRNGVNLAFETSLLYLDVTNSRVGINTITPTNELQVNGTTRTTNLYVSTQAQIGTVGSQFTITGNTISSDNATINLLPQGVNPVVYQGTISVGNININTNTISTTGTNTNLEISPTGTGIVEINSNATVYGNLHATGSITADGNIQLGDQPTDTVTFSAEVNSDIIPSTTNYYNLGSSSNLWKNLYVTNVSSTGITTTDFTSSGNLTINGTTTISGTTKIGQSSANVLNVIARINSNLVPATTLLYDLGTSGLYWNTAYINTVNTSGLTITNNSITSTATNSNLLLSANGTGQIYIPSNNLQVDNNASIQGNLTVGGITSLQDVGITSTLTQTGNFNQTGNFTTSGSIQAGNITTSGTLTIPNFTISGSTITSTSNNANFNLVATGTGQVTMPSSVEIGQNLTIQNNLTVSGTTTLNGTSITGTVGQTGNFNQTGDFTTSGNLTVIGNASISVNLTISNITIGGSTIATNQGNLDLNIQGSGTGSVIVESVKFTDNNIQSVGTNANLLLTPQGNASVIINNNGSFVLPVGTTNQRPDPASNGMIRYNTDLTRYEGYNVDNWYKLGGVESTDGKTRITPELSPGAGDNIIRFYANNVLVATIDPAKLYAIDFQTSNLDISNSTISAISANSDINLNTSGSGAVVIGNLRFAGNSITNVASNAVTEFVENGNGYVKISGTYGLVIPSGDENQRPALQYTEVGMTRYNTTYQYVEVFNGVSWNSVSGTSTGVTFNDATDIGIETALMIG